MYSTRHTPLVVSHRGMPKDAPENTIAAFVAALDAGAQGIELDIHASADGMLFVHHDPAFATAPGVSSAFASTDSKEVKSARLDGGHAIPTLDEVIEVVSNRALLFIEIKPRGIEADVARCLRRHQKRIEQLAVHSFDHRAAKRMLELVPSIRTGILQVGYPVDSRAAMRAAGASDLWQQTDFVDERLVADIHASGGRVIVWTPNDPSQWGSLSRLGVDGICTDRIDELMDWRNTASAP